MLLYKLLFEVVWSFFQKLRNLRNFWIMISKIAYYTKHLKLTDWKKNILESKSKAVA